MVATITMEGSSRRSPFFLRLFVTLLFWIGGCWGEEDNTFVATVEPPKEEFRQLNVAFEYQIEVFDESARSALAAMSDMKQDLLNSIQLALPNGNFLASVDASLSPPPTVQFRSMESREFSKCFTAAQDCSLIRSTIAVHYQGNKPRQSLEFVTLRLVQRYLEYYSNKNDNTRAGEVTATYQYPTIVQTLSQFQLFHDDDSTQRTMSALDVKMFEDAFVEVFGAIVFALEGDTDIRDAQFVYQDVRTSEITTPTPSITRSTTNQLQPERGSRLLEEEVPYNTTNTTQTVLLQVDLVVRGICRKCTSEEFGRVVNQVIASNLVAFRTKLVSNGKAQNDIDFFDTLTSIRYAVPTLPTGLEPTTNDHVYDTSPPLVKRRLPWFLWFGSTLALLIVSGAVYLFCFVDPDYYDKDHEDDNHHSRHSDGSHSQNGIVSEEDSEDFDQAGGYASTPTNNPPTAAMRQHTPTFRRIEGTGDIVTSGQGHNHHHSHPGGHDGNYEVYVL